MRLLHTSDWHLGRSFHGEDLLAAQASYVDHLLATVETEGYRYDGMVHGFFAMAGTGLATSLVRVGDPAPSTGAVFKSSQPVTVRPAGP